VGSRSRCKNEIHAVLMRRLKGRPPVSDLFGVKGRKWLGELELPVEEAESIASAMRHSEQARVGVPITLSAQIGFASRMDAVVSAAVVRTLAPVVPNAQSQEERPPPAEIGLNGVNRGPKGPAFIEINPLVAARARWPLSATASVPSGRPTP
jgi:hypothetical protein